MRGEKVMLGEKKAAERHWSEPIPGEKKKKGKKANSKAKAKNVIGNI